MTTKQFLNSWRIGVAVATGIVAAVAILLIAIIATARSILSNAVKALNVANEIVETTRPIWNLKTTNAVAAQLAEEAQAIELHATQIADTLEHMQPAEQ